MDSAPKKRRLGVKLIVALLVLLVLLASAVLVFVVSKLSKLQHVEAPDEITITEPLPAENEMTVDISAVEQKASGDPLPEGEATESRDVVNILFLGSDFRMPGTNDPGRADAIMLCSLNKKEGTVKLVSFERAIGVPIPDRPSDLLTHSFHYGGAELTTDIVRECFRLDIDGYANVDFDSFIQVIDALGGVDIELSADEAWAISGESDYGARYFNPGVNHLDGVAALSYCRLRAIDSDWMRITRQRATIKAVVDKVKTLSLSELNDLADTVLPLVKTDLTMTQIASLLLAAPRFLHAEVEQRSIPDSSQVWGYTNEVGRALFGCDFEACADELDRFLYE